MNRNLIVVMSLSGSFISIFWFIVFKFYFLEFKAKWLRNMLLMAIPFFLFPIPLFQHLFFKLFMATGILPASLVRDIEGDIDKTYMIVSQGNGSIFSLWEMLLLVIAVLTASVSFICILQQISSYLKLRRAIKHDACLPLSQWETEQLAETKRQLRVKQNVRLIKSSKASGPFTIGVFRPVIVIPEKLPEDDNALQIVLGHELTHVKHRDALFNLIACVILSLHWFNLCCYIYLVTLKRACELYCDETVTETLVNLDKFAYCRVMIQLANDGDLSNDLFTLNFTGKDAKKQIQRRIDNIMKGKKCKLGMAVALGSFMLTLGLGSTFVYADTDKMYVEQNGDFSYNCEDAFHVETSDLDTDMIYEDSFTDDEGNIYPCENTESRIICIHSWVNGTRTVHKKNGTGGCTMDYYHAKRCKICGTVVSYDLYYTGIWKTCPH